MAYRDPEQCRARHRERLRKRTTERRAGDARFRTADKLRRNPEKAREHQRNRSRRQAAAHVAQGLCTECGQAPAEPNRRMCEPSADNRSDLFRGIPVWEPGYTVTELVTGDCHGPFHTKVEANANGYAGESASQDGGY